MDDLNLQETKTIEVNDKITTEEIKERVREAIKEFRDELVRLIQYQDLDDEVMAEEQQEVIFSLRRPKELAEFIVLYLLSDQNEMTAKELIVLVWDEIRNEYQDKLGKKHKRQFYNYLNEYVRGLNEEIIQYLLKFINDNKLNDPSKEIDSLQVGARQVKSKIYDLEFEIRRSDNDEEKLKLKSEIDKLQRKNEILYANISFITGKKYSGDYKIDYYIEELARLIREKESTEAITEARILIIKQEIAQNINDVLYDKSEIIDGEGPLSELKDGKYKVKAFFAVPLLDGKPVKDTVYTSIRKGSVIQVTHEEDRDKVRIEYRGGNIFCPVKYNYMALELEKIS